MAWAQVQGSARWCPLSLLDCPAVWPWGGLVRGASTQRSLPSYVQGPLSTPSGQGRLATFTRNGMSQRSPHPSVSWMPTALPAGPRVKTRDTLGAAGASHTAPKSRPCPGSPALGALSTMLPLKGRGRCGADRCSGWTACLLWGGSLASPAELPALSWTLQGPQRDCSVWVFPCPPGQQQPWRGPTS